MSDITANVVVSMPSQLFTAARSFKALGGGKIYVGKTDTDPTIPENQIQVYIENEDGSLVPVPQPIVINAGGFPVYNGQIAKFVTDDAYSMAVYNSFNGQEFYFSNLLTYNSAQLQRNIIKPDGLKYVGACESVTQLRGTEPEKSGQRIQLSRYDATVSTGGGVLFYDSNDKESPDDGVYCFVTPSGARWKREKEFIDLYDAGLSPLSFDYSKLQAFASSKFPKKSIPFSLTSSSSLVFSPGEIEGCGNTIKFTAGGATVGSEANFTVISAQLSEQTMKASNTIKLSDVSSLAVGDIIVLSNTIDYSFSRYRNFYKDGEFNEIVSINTATKVVTLLESVRGIYPTAGTIVVKVNKTAPVSISNLAIETSDSVVHAIQFICTTGISILNFSATGGRDAAIRFDRCYRVRGAFINGKCNAEPGITDIQYGLFVGNTQNFSITDGEFYGTRHGVSHGGQNQTGNVPSRDGTFSNCTFASRDFACADTHGNAETIKFINCRMSNGMAIGGRDIEISDCRVSSGAYISPVVFTEFSGGYFKLLNCRLVRMPSATRNAWVVWNDTSKADYIELDFNIIAENNEIIGDSGTEFINLPVAVPTSIRWSVRIDGIKTRTPTFINVLSLTKLTRSDSQPVADATSVVVLGIDANFDISAISPVVLGGAWSGSATRFNLQSCSTLLKISSATGEYLSSDFKNFTHFKYPVTPAITAQVAGNAFNGTSMVRAVITAATNAQCEIRLATGNTANTFSSATEYRVLVTVSFDGLRIS